MKAYQHTSSSKHPPKPGSQDCSLQGGRGTFRDTTPLWHCPRYAGRTLLPVRLRGSFQGSRHSDASRVHKGLAAFGVERLTLWLAALLSVQLVSYSQNEASSKSVSSRWKSGCASCFHLPVLFLVPLVTHPCELRSWGSSSKADHPSCVLPAP